MPKYFQSQSEADTGMALSVKKQKVYLEETVSTAEGKSRTDKKRVNLVFCWLWQTKSIVIILRMTLSEYFRCIVLDAPDRIISASVQNNPDVIVVDETVNGVYGEELCSKVKADKAIANIPVILLIKSADK